LPAHVTDGFFSYGYIKRLLDNKKFIKSRRKGVDLKPTWNCGTIEYKTYEFFDAAIPGIEEYQFLELPHRPYDPDGYSNHRMVTSQKAFRQAH